MKNFRERDNLSTLIFFLNLLKFECVFLFMFPILRAFDTDSVLLNNVLNARIMHSLEEQQYSKSYLRQFNKIHIMNNTHNMSPILCITSCSWLYALDRIDMNTL